MSALKPQSTPSAITSGAGQIAWPDLVLPEEHPTFGLPPGTKQTIEQWYSSLQGAINTHNTLIASQLDSLQKQLKTSGK